MTFIPRGFYLPFLLLFKKKKFRSEYLRIFPPVSVFWRGKGHGCGGVSRGKQLRTGWTGVTEGGLRGDSFEETVVYIFLLVMER